MMGKLDKLEAVEKEVKRRKTEGLSINRVPEPTRSQFIELAENEFAGDYGMTLKWLMTMTLDLYPELDELRSMLLSVDQRVAALESPPEKKNVRTTLGGKVIKEED